MEFRKIIIDASCDIQGQCCCAGSRTYVHERVYDEFVEKAKARALKRAVGDPFKEGIEQGPQVNMLFQETSCLIIVLELCLPNLFEDVIFLQYGIVALRQLNTED